MYTFGNKLRKVVVVNTCFIYQPAYLVDGFSGSHIFGVLSQFIIVIKR